jgi:hypothetical protein
MNGKETVIPKVVKGSLFSNVSYIDPKEDILYMAITQQEFIVKLLLLEE